MTPATKILMPALPPTAGQGALTRWLVAEGDRVAAGDVIAEVAGGRLSMEVEVEAAGVIEQLLVEPGATAIAVSTPIAILRQEPASEVCRPSSVTTTIATPPAPISRASSAAEARLTLREALRDALAEEMRRDPAVFVMGRHITRDGGAYTANHGLLEEFGPRRVVDTPPLSQTLAGVAIGAAINGLRPVVEVTSWNAALPTLSLIVDTAAKLQLMSGAELTVPLVVRGPDGAYPGCGAQHAQSLAAWLAHVPGLKVVAPADPADAKGLLKAAIRDDGPVLILESEALYETEGAVPSDSDHVVALGRARIVRRGTDITIATFGRSVALALAAADQLADEGIAVEVVDLRSLRPLDVETVVASVRSTHRLLTLEDGWPVCSIGAEICATVASAAFDALSAPPQRIAGEDMAMPYAASLARRALPDKDMLIAAVRRLCHVDR